MNICIITPLYPIANRIDIKTDTQAIHLLVKYLTQEHNVHVFNISRVSSRNLIRSMLTKGDSLKYQYDYKIDNVNATLLRYRAFPKQQFLTSNQLKIIRTKIKNTLLQKNFYPDVIVTHIPSVFSDLLIGMYEDVKRVAVLHITDIHVLSSKPNIIKKINKQYDLIVSRSKSIQQKANSLGLNIEKGIVFSGIPKKYLDNDGVRSFNLSCRPIRILYVGKLIKRKHPEYIINLCETLNTLGKPTIATIIGDGPLKKKIITQIDKLKFKDKITMIQSLSRDQVQEQMKEADIFILPSVNETLGLVYMEAMAAGCITIGVENEGIDGIITSGENGYLIKPENYEDLLCCVLSIIHLEPQEIQSMSQIAIQTAKNFPEEKASENYFEIIKNLQY